MKPFIVIAVLLITGGTFLLVAGAVQVVACIKAGTFALDIWSPGFWLLVPGRAALGLAPNAAWFLRLVSGAGVIIIGRIVLRVARR